MNAGNADGVAALYDEQAILVADPKRIVRGRDAIRDGLANMLAARPRLTLNAERIVRNGDVAILYSDWTIAMLGPDGKRMSVDVRPTVVAQRDAGGDWLIVIDDPSVDEAPQSQGS
jgi:uncharacterized protein (TIGR02246 family)